MLSVAASPWLATELNDLLVRLQARRKRLMTMRRESNERMADLPSRMSLFWLNALNSAEPVLAEQLSTPERHPELLYRELTRLAGSLLTFTGARPLAIFLLISAMYRSGYSRRYAALLDKLRSEPAVAGEYPPEHQDQIWKGALHDARLREGRTSTLCTLLHAEP